MYERYCKIRNSLGYKDADVARNTNITKSIFSEWKAGRSIPKTDKLQKIANFLGISLDYLTTGKETQDSKKYYLNDETAKMAQKIFENKELRMLFDIAQDAAPEDLKIAYTMILALKRKEQKNINN